MPDNFNMQAIRIEAPSPSHARFESLDAIRGIAALLIVMVHAQDGLGGLPNPGSGYVAVDLFFLLSGFVIANAYDQRLAGDMSFLDFVRVRLIRLYPLYFLSMIISMTKFLIQLGVGAQPRPLDQIAIEFSLALFMLPSPSTIHQSPDFLFPLNPAAWSLFFEVAVNIAFAARFHPLSKTMLVVLVGLLGAGLIATNMHFGSVLVGGVWSTILYGFVRSGFPFFLGVLLFRAHFALPNLGSIWLWGGLVLLTALLMIDPGPYRALYDITLVIVVFPSMVLIASAIKAHGFTQSFAQVSGQISYALYVLHMPILAMLLAVLRRLSPEWQLSPLLGPVFVLALLIGCWFADRWYDAPVRRWLSKRIQSIPN